ncbi:MAG TPA: class I tRNA ligase family protein [Streptosporangiaceae bacterium]|nr:class I tRNA ligase family protein [Streptosporangiaceae bacterium]
MIISTYDEGHLHRSFGIDLGDIDLGAVEAFGVGANFARVAPGKHSDPHQHDETETFVIFSGQGDIVTDAKRTPITAPMVVQFEPFETHYLDNAGTEDIFFTTFYWRDAPRAIGKAQKNKERRRFGDRPVFVFSTPPTPNGGLHIGHLSGPYLGTDAFVRFQRMNGTEVYHLAATDDFQSYVVDCARREGRTPGETAELYATEIKETLAAMDIHPDQVNHTSREPGYQEALQAFFTALVNSGKVTRGEGQALFDGETGQYLYEPYVDGGCPGCGSETGGNICEICGEPNFCVDLTDPQSAIGAATPRAGTIIRYMLPLHELRDELLEHHSVGRVPAKVRELAHRLFSRDRLDMALTHPSDWGVRPVQDDVPGQVIWVWIELGFGFIYGIETLGRKLGKDWKASDPQDDWKIVHFLGYDNTFYHSIFSPALYKLASPSWTPDVDYNVNEFYLLDGDKFSTSRRHVIWGKDILRPDNVDAIRFYLALTRPETRRSNFTIEEYEAMVTGTLVGRWQAWLDDLGARVSQRYAGAAPDAGIWTPEHTAFLASLQNSRDEITAALGQDGFSLNQAARALDEVVTKALRFRDSEALTAGLPDWKDENRTAIALELAAAKLLAHCAAPVMPRFAAKLGGALGIGEPTVWPDLVTLVPPGTEVSLAGRVFFRDPGDLLPWLSAAVAEVLQINGAVDPEATLAGLGSTSMHAIALQYQILQRTGKDIAIDDLLGDRTVADLAELVANREEEGTEEEVVV